MPPVAVGKKWLKYKKRTIFMQKFWQSQDIKTLQKNVKEDTKDESSCTQTQVLIENLM